MMCSAKGFCKIKARFNKALSHHHGSMMGLTRRDDGSHTPNELRLCALLDAWCFAPCCVTHNARGAIFLDSLTSKLADSFCGDYPAQVTTRVDAFLASK